MNKLIVKINERWAQNAKFIEFIGQLPLLFMEQGEILYCKRNIIKKFYIECNATKTLKPVIVKRYKTPNWVQRVVYSFFRKSKAERAFFNGAELLRRGVSTPENLAYIETWHRGLFMYGYYVSDVDDAPPIQDQLITAKDFNRTMADDFAEFVLQLHSKGILHHDLNSTNVLYHSQKDGHYTFSLIDINRMDFVDNGQQLNLNDCLENLTRFTGRMDLFEYVARHYATAHRGDTEAIFRKMMEIKRQHDAQWKRRKSLLRKFHLKK